jgi:Mrp family chromosome partitioning ATPase
MSRIHEALQRAAEQRASGVSTGEVDATAPAGDPPNGANEVDELDFPIELSERRRPRPAAPAAALAQPQAGAASGTGRRESASTSPQPVAFERVHTRYAGKIVIDQEISGASREQYRRLAATLHQAQAATGVKVIMVTSALMGEGKTLTSSNLALTLSESYQKHVLLVDADLRRPAVHTVFQVRNASGLSEGLAEGSDRKVAVQQLSNRLGILAAGQPTSDPIAGLTSARMRRLLEEAREAFDWVIVDTPPVALL